MNPFCVEQTIFILVGGPGEQSTSEEQHFLSGAHAGVILWLLRFLVVGVDVVVETGKLLFPGAFPLAVGRVGGYISILRLRVRLS